MSGPRSICYVLSYYAPDYVRTRTLVNALRQIEGVRLYEARNSSKGLRRYFETLWKLLLVRLRHDPQAYLLGFRGYEHFWPVRLLTAGRTLIYDHMMSPYDSLVNETGRVRKGGLLAGLIRFYERSILMASDLVLTDTDAHRLYFQDLFQIGEGRIAAVPVAADEEVFQPTKQAAPDEPFEVLYFGSFLPLHGMDVILEAAAALKDLPVHITLIGGNRLDLSAFHRKVQEFRLGNVSHVGWVDFEDLPGYIARSHIGLGGPFGGTGQARRVITGKTFQFLAMAKPVIVGEIEQDCGFIDKVNCLLVPQGNPGALAQAISWAFQHPAELGQMGRRGYELYRERYSIQQVSGRLKELLFA